MTLSGLRLRRSREPLMLMAAVLGALLLWLSVSPATSTADAASHDLLYPNLRAQPARDFRFDTITIDGAEHVVIRLSATSYNAGFGPLDLRVGDLLGGKRNVVQYFLRSDGQWEADASPAGAFEYHPGHGHFHFENFARYTLRRPDDSPDNPRAHGAKTTFCIMDTDRVDRKLSDAPKRAVYNTCGGENQGMSVGWGDTYGYRLVGQWVDVTELENGGRVEGGANGNNGDYILRLDVDPNNVLDEFNRDGSSGEDDNSSEVAVCIDFDTRTVTAGSCAGGGGGGPGNGNAYGRVNRPPR